MCSTSGCRASRSVRAACRYCISRRALAIGVYEAQPAGVVFATLFEDERVVWLENAGDGSAWTLHELPAAPPASALAAGDIDGDTDVVASTSAGVIAWWERL